MSSVNSLIHCTGFKDLCCHILWDVGSLVNNRALPNVTHYSLFHCHKTASLFLSSFLVFILSFPLSFLLFLVITVLFWKQLLLEADKSISCVPGKRFWAKRRHDVLHRSGAWKAASSFSHTDLSHRTFSPALSAIEPLMMGSVSCWMVSSLISALRAAQGN